MNERLTTSHPELDELFERYRRAPESTVFAPLADACRKAGMLEEALEICARGIAANPRYASGYVVQGKCCFDAGKKVEAEAAFNRVLAIDAHNLVALKFLGILHADRGDRKAARGYFEHILNLDPDNKEIRGRYEDVVAAGAAVAPASRPVVDAATEESEDAAVELPDIQEDGFEGEPITLRDATVTTDDIATLTLADIYLAQGHAARALRIYREVLKLQPDNLNLRAKIEALTPAPPVEVEPVVPAPAPAPSAQAAPEPQPGPARASAPATPSKGSPIDEGRSYEQFKRWLRSSSQ